MINALLCPHAFSAVQLSGDSGSHCFQKPHVFPVKRVFCTIAPNAGKGERGRRRSQPSVTIQHESLPRVLSNGLRWPRFRINSQTLETPALAGLIFVSILSRLLKRTCKDANNMLCAIALSAKITNSEQESESFIVQFCGYAHC